MELECFHGTSRECAKDIQNSTFNESDGPNHWLGRGIYFFVAGISDPLDDSVDWAKAQAWDKSKRTYTYNEYSVLKCIVSINDDDVIDLTNAEGLRLFNESKKALFDKIFENFNIKIKGPNSDNCQLFNYMVNFSEAGAVKHYLYIKPKKERRLKLRLHVPNTTVFCVRKDAFNAEKIDVVCEGKTNE